jgi:ABC-type nitrate/sulfonate/bicarbonate transport system permease component
VTVRRARLPLWAVSTIGVVALVAVWWVVAAVFFAPRGGGSYAAIPTPPQVVQAFVDDGIGFFWKAFSVTLGEAAIGYLWGNGLALALSALVIVLPWLEGVLGQVAVITYCIPIVAIGPLALIILGGAERAGDPSKTAIFLAALSVFFTTVVGTLLGLKAADRASLDVVSVYGGSRFTQLRKVRLIAALPSVLSALQIAVPAAFLGAVLGEYFGKIEIGVTPILVSAAVSLNSPRVWAIFLLCALVAIVGYAALGLVGRLITPWSTGRQS